MTALLCGVFGSCLGLVPALGIAAFPFAVVGLACGVIAMIRASKGVRAGKAMAIAGTLLCVLALILATFWIVVIANSFKDRGDSRKAITGQSTEDILRNDLDVQFGQFVTDDNPDRSGKMIVTLRNKSNKSASFSVDVEALDASGNRIAGDTAFVEVLAPGQATRKDMFVFVASDKHDAMKKATFRVVEASKYAPMPPPVK
ncbi:DUF4190 domain-containing protein [Mycobacterium kansasii]|uniref:DUF4190 domain-containing protein n=2 Tax=Mycobacterium kansasii TaxID=1768 RepID=A0A653EWU6_MYCKA|nr:DUF4190 domain-containing protein [Mycobacterium kansasii]KEP40028.1 hypothetical protein MKSMC1_48390 [Mycobacterium kansasii]MXO39843.1 DUF4190 domain-containing protein [Mycobacterium kansasii]UCA20609.1 DUF4190 domain-containing protein [Mycobacterium kansasii]UGT80662.1 DUF4190 domain-containing protein [Mycobacterium kansasii]UGT84941.1 DUF4190 domain-containing protein [Mycobacterium kansasii]